MDIAKEYNDRFDQLRKNRVEVSCYKYGPAAINFGRHYVDALGSMEKCVAKYKDTGNKEYLCDAANYLMFEFMYPSLKNAYFKATDSGESAGIEGISINEMNQMKEEIV